MLIASFLVNILGILLFLFIFWKRMKEDYSSEIIFRAGFYTLLFMGVFRLISFNFFKDWFIWFSLVGAIIGLLISIKSQRIRFYESLESLVISILPWLSLIFLSDSISSQSLISFLGFLYILVIMFLSYWLENNYKKFSWYKSGKVGLAGLVILSIIFISRVVVAFFEIPMLSFVQNLDLWISTLFLLISIFLIFQLSNQNDKR